MVHHLVHHVPHVVRAAGVLGHHVAEVRLAAVGRVVGRVLGRVVDVVAGQVNREGWRTSFRHSSSVSQTKWATPLRVAWVAAPPSSSCPTSSPVTARITSGPVIYIWPISFTMKMKSVMAGEYTAPARSRADDDGDLGDDAGVEGISQEYIAVGRQAECALLDAGAAGVVEPDDGAAGLGSQGPMTLQIFWLTASEREPPMTVKSWAKAKIWRPSTFPYPVTTASPKGASIAQAKIGGPVGYEGVQLLKGALVHKTSETLESSELAPAVLLVDAVLPASQPRGAIASTPGLPTAGQSASAQRSLVLSDPSERASARLKHPIH